MKIIFFSSELQKEVDDVVSVDFTGDNGKFRILKDHDCLVSLLSKGRFSYVKKDNKEVNFEVNNGIINVKNNILNVVLTSHSGDIA